MLYFVDISVGFPYFLFVSHVNLNYFLKKSGSLAYSLLYSGFSDNFLVMLFILFLLVRFRSLTVFGLFLFFFFQEYISHGMIQEVYHNLVILCDVKLGQWVRVIFAYSITVKFSVIFSSNGFRAAADYCLP